MLKDINPSGLAISSHSHHQRNLKLIRLINFTYNSKGTPEGGPLPRGGDHAGNGSFSIFHAVSSRWFNLLILFVNINIEVTVLKMSCHLNVLYLSDNK
nr:hypothetical protein [Providencia sp. PROV019]